MNFVNNYYKMGPSTSQSTLMTLQLEGTGKGSQSVYVSGNIRQEKNNGKLTEDKKGTTYKYSTSGGQVVDWDPLPTSPFAFFNPEGNAETAQAAFKNVLSDAGCTLLDLEKLGITTESRPSDWDTDQDGMPNWFEELKGTNPYNADNNEDPDGDGYTNLEDYLNWMAEPNYQVAESMEINLADWFAGYSTPSYTISDGMEGTINGNLLIVTPSGENLFSIKVTATEDGISLTRQFNFACTTGASGINEFQNIKKQESRWYNLNGQPIISPQHGVYIHNGKKVVK